MIYHLQDEEYLSLTSENNWAQCRGTSSPWGTVSRFRSIDGTIQIPNKVTVALMTPPVHLDSKTLQEAGDNHETILHFGMVQGCHKTRSPYPLYT